MFLLLLVQVLNKFVKDLVSLSILIHNTCFMFKLCCVGPLSLEIGINLCFFFFLSC